ncbi:MAG: RNA-binding protein [Phycisphaeraceae bacterium]|nr:RNA-binding protein [Phycisphaeraceae bacterium]MCB9848738.1 RNA-binding protein [Phycisphaeraceae bacterium]
MTVMKKLYVGNLPFGVGDVELRELFSAHGSVRSASVINDRETGRSRGFGFIEMDNDGEAMEAIEKMNGAECQGRNLTVNEARPREPRSGGFGGGGGGGRGGW